ncbi:MAG: 3-oxoadipate enol-lactonase [Pseudomonadota bacterium]
MDFLDLGDVVLHVKAEGPEDGPPVVFANSLGTDLRLWDPVIARLPPGLRLIRYDKRGHGLSTCPPAPYSMGALIKDTEAVCAHFNATNCVFVGLSIGGMIAQGLAAKRLDLIRAVVLSNTAPKIGTRDMWDDRIATLRTSGLAGMSDTILARWFAPAFYKSRAAMPWRRMLETTPEEGYAGCAAAIAGTDFYSTTAALRLPALVIAGDHDGSTPPDLVKELADLIPGARYDLIRGAGHLPCVEQPDAFKTLLTGFLQDIGHIDPAP